MDRVFPAIRGVYSLIGSSDRISAQIFDFPHNYNQTSRNAVYAAMSHWLFRIDDPAQTKEGEQKLEKPEDLWTLSAEHPAPPDRKTPEQLEAYLIANPGPDARRPGAGLKPGTMASSPRLLLTSLKIRTGIETPAHESIVEQEVRSISRDDGSIMHSTVGRKSKGDAIPVVKLMPRQFKNRLTILAHPRGKAALAGGSRPAKRAGTRTACPRPRRRRVRPAVRRRIARSRETRCLTGPNVAHFETYNPSRAADQMQDLATVVAWAKSQPDVDLVNLVAQDDAGYQALVARPMLEGLSRTVIELSEHASIPKTRRMAGHRSTWPGSSSSAASRRPRPFRLRAALALPKRRRDRIELAPGGLRACRSSPDASPRARRPDSQSRSPAGSTRGGER